MSEIADFLRARYAERRELADSIHRRDCESVPDILYPDRETGACDCGEPEAAVADLDARLALVDELEPPPPVEPEATVAEDGWCCLSTLHWASECPLCPQYGTRLDDPCPGHPPTGPNKTRVAEAQLHASSAHPGYEYRTTEGPRKQWDDSDQPPYGDDGEPDHTWKRNIDAGRPGMGWDRFDHTEESYWRRLRPGGPRPQAIPRALRILAQPYAGHPDHKGAEWAP